MTLLDAFDDPMFVVDDERHLVVLTNEAAVRRLRLDRDAVGTTILDIAPNRRERRRLAAALAEVTSGGTTPPLELTVIDDSGRSVPAHGWLFRLPTGVDGSMLLQLQLQPHPRTIDRRAIESRLRAVAVLDALQDAVVEMDLMHDTYVYCNPRFTELTGMSLAELLDTRPPTAGVAPESAPMVAAMVEHASTDGPESERILMSGPDGEFPASVTAVRVPRDRHRWMVLTFRDLRHEESTEAALRAAHQQLAVADDRDRIARDLHDNVIQRLFAAGISLQAAVGLGDQTERMLRVVDELDEIMREIRETIYPLQRRRPTDEGLGLAVRSLVDQSVMLLGHSPELEIRGDPDRVPPTLRPEVLAILRELLTNVAKHAQATRTTVLLIVDDHVSLTVADNGIGLQDSHGVGAGFGLANLRERAHRHAGSVTADRDSDGGAAVSIRIPLPGR